jgi:cytochrome c553
MSLLAGRSIAAVAAILLTAAAAPHTARAEDNARGAELFQLCGQCHGDRGQGNALALAPSIAGLPEWYVAKQLEAFKSGVRGTHHDDVGGLRMYPMSQTLKTPEDLKAVAAFVAAMPHQKQEPTLTGGDPAKGAQLYQVCASCHGPDGSGNQAVGSPPLAGQADWYMLSSLHKYQTGIRSRDALAAVMRGMAATLPDDQAKKDVIAHIMTLTPKSTPANTAAK